MAPDHDPDPRPPSDRSAPSEPHQPAQPHPTAPPPTSTDAAMPIGTTGTGAARTTSARAAGTRSVRARPRRRQVALRRGDLLAALVAVAAIGYTIFAFVHVSTEGGSRATGDVMIPSGAPDGSPSV